MLPFFQGNVLPRNGSDNHLFEQDEELAGALTYEKQLKKCHKKVKDFFGIK